MGIDAVIRASWPKSYSDEDFLRLRDAFRDTFPDEDPESEWRYPDLVKDAYERSISVEMCDRYFGPGHERGYWPRLRA